MIPLRALSPGERLRVLAVDAIEWLPRAGASPHLSHYGITARDDDGIVTGRGRVGGQPCLFAAQDERFLGGTIGAMHADALCALFERARRERPAAVVLLLASAGVRLYETNAAVLALARTLRALFDARADGIPVLGIAAGDVFGGASVLACACDRLALLPGTRFGLSGPLVIETAHGRAEVDSSDPSAVGAVFGAQARASAGIADLVADDADAMRAWLLQGMRDAISFPLRVLELQERLAARLSASGDDHPEPRWLDVEPQARLVRLRAAGGVLGPRQAIAADAALLAADDRDLAHPRTIVIVEDSAGHEATIAAERLGISQYLAHHAAVLGLLRSRGHRIVGWLAGAGHSAAFVVNALQADTLYAAPDARVIAMAPDAIARVTGLDRARLALAIEEDPMLGQPVRHLAALGGVAEVVPDEATLRARL